MLLGTVQVKSLLSDDYPATDKEIQDALWHYFYDIDKTVTYLKNLKKPPAQSPKKTKTKQASRFDQAAKAAEAKVNLAEGELDTFSFKLALGSCRETCTSTCPMCSHLESSRPPPYSNVSHGIPGSNTECTLDKVICPYSASFSLVRSLPSVADFFWDTPWGKVPPHRLGNIEAVSLYPRGGLLGGSGRPSKMAALAAARKKKEEERQASAQATQPDRSIALLDRLGSKKEDGVSSASGTNSTAPIAEPVRPARASIFHKKPPSPVQEPSPSPPAADSTPTPPQPAPDLRARPSVFAQTMFGHRTPTAGGVSLQLDEMELDPPTRHQQANIFKLPYINDPTDLQAFSGPSPDDVVLRAQSKGPAHV
jgi:elongation factor 1 alpha-like protein